MSCSDPVPQSAATPFAQVLEKIEDLPPLPAVALALLRLGDGSEADLCALCERLQALID